MRAVKTAPSDIENGLISEGYGVVAGVDEVGRGPLAGPVVACALILPAGIVIEGVYDSKKVTEKRREKLAQIIKESAIAYSINVIEPEEIDRINILQATMLAMVNAVDALEKAPDAILVDGTTRPDFKNTAKVLCIPKGDSASHLIAAASIVAKVERDFIMQKLHELYPFYAWDKNKGYGTAAHTNAIKEHGLCPIHRKSFCKGFL